MNQENVFRCKRFQIVQDRNVMKVNSDGMLLGAWSDVSDRNKVLDIGTGTGVIALMIAQRNPLSIIDGIEIHEDSAVEAAENFASSDWADRLTCIHDSLQSFSGTTNEKYDLIVSNPPFFSGGTFSVNENKNNVRHTTKLSHGDLLIAVSRLLTDNGRFDVILPYIEGERLIDMARRYDLKEYKVTQLRPSKEKPIERLLISLSRDQVTFEREELIMYDNVITHEYSAAYKSITKDFYLKF